MVVGKFLSIGSKTHKPFYFNIMLISRVFRLSGTVRASPDGRRSALPLLARSTPSSAGRDEGDFYVAGRLA
jgi:hypothetical protein